MNHGLSEAEWERGDHEYHQRKDDGGGSPPRTMFKRFYIIQRWETG
jgi:hypothetical protein